MTGNVQALEISPDGKWLATWSGNTNQIQLWQLDAARTSSLPVKIIPGSRDFVFSPDGTCLASCWGKTCHLWRTGTWEEQKRGLENFSGDLQGALALGRAEPEGRTLLALAGSAAIIHRLELDQGAGGSARVLARLESPDRKPVLGLAFNQNGSRLAAAAADQTVQVWDLARIREKLAQMDLAGALRKFERAPEGSLNVEFESEARDTDRPKKWREVEQATATLTNASDRDAQKRFEAHLKRGKARLDLGRPKEALEDFEEALGLNSDATAVEQLIRKAKALMGQRAD